MLVETPIFDVIRKKTSVLVRGEFYPVHLVEEFSAIPPGPVSVKLPRKKRSGTHRIKSIRDDFFSGRSSEDCSDGRVESGWSSEDDLLMANSEELNWEVVPETRVNELLAGDVEEENAELMDEEKQKEESYREQVCENQKIAGGPTGIRQIQMVEIDKLQKSMPKINGSGFNQVVVQEKHTDILKQVSSLNAIDKGDEAERSGADSDLFNLGPMIDKAMKASKRRLNKKKISIKKKSTQQSRFEEWRNFVQDLKSGGEEIVGVRRGKPKAKRGRKPKNKKSKLDGGDIVSDSQINSCNNMMIRKSCAEEAEISMKRGVELGFINKGEGTEVWKIFMEWEKRDRAGKESLEEGLEAATGTGANKSGS